jgi:galactose mutarotase-like enzyme
VGAYTRFDMEVVPYLGHSIRRWQIGSATFLAWPEAGARLMHWSLTRGDGTVREVIHWPELTEISSITKVRGGNPILFPFCGRTFDAGEIHVWRDPQGVRRPMPMHGLARQGRFHLAAINDAGFDAVFAPDETAREAYPFEYEFRVCYRFGALSLACEFMLTNLGDSPLPWSAGHHFYFAVPWADSQTRHDYVLELAAGRTARQDPNGTLVDGPNLPRSPSLAEPSLLDTMHLQLRRSACTFGLRDGSEQITLKHGTRNVPAPEATFVTWTEKDDSPFYCVEPWMSPPNAPEHKQGLHWVNPGQTQRFAVEVLVR